jgi:DNA-binding NarL/FixJ family response regulator
MLAPRFLIIDDHPLFLEAMQSVLGASFGKAEIEVAETIAAAKHCLERSRYNLVLLDLQLPDTVGLNGLMELRQSWPKTPLAVISALADPEILHKVRNIGANGFIHKSLGRQGIVEAVNSLLAGGECFPQAMPSSARTAASAEGSRVLKQLRELTPQQFKVLMRICEAKLNKQIAYELDVTETTVKAHITSIFKKLGVHSRTQAVLLIQRAKADNTSFELESLVVKEASDDVG